MTSPTASARLASSGMSISSVMKSVQPLRAMHHHLQKCPVPPSHWPKSERTRENTALIALIPRRPSRRPDNTRSALLHHGNSCWIGTVTNSGTHPNSNGLTASKNHCRGFGNFGELLFEKISKKFPELRASFPAKKSLPKSSKVSQNISPQTLQGGYLNRTQRSRKKVPESLPKKNSDPPF